MKWLFFKWIISPTYLTIQSHIAFEVINLSDRETFLHLFFLLCFDYQMAIISRKHGFIKVNMSIFGLEIRIIVHFGNRERHAHRVLSCAIVCVSVPQTKCTKWNRKVYTKLKTVCCCLILELRAPFFFGRRHHRRRRRLSFYIPDKITEYKYSLFIRNQLHMNNNYGTLVHVFIVIYDSSLDPTDGENIFRTKKK